MKILLFLICLPFLSFSQKNYNYKNLVLEGGGIRGLAYPGVLQVLEEKSILKNIEKVAGTSAGAIIALMVGLGYNSHDIDYYKLALINLLQDTLGRKTFNLENEKGRTIYISYGNVFGKIRKVSATEKNELFNNGMKAAEIFFTNLNAKPIR